MKLSLSWIFDHIHASWKQYDIAELVEQFNVRTAEIEHVQKVIVPLNIVTIVGIIAIDEVVTAYSAEHAQEYILPIREDAIVGALYLIIKRGENAWDWMSIIDFAATKDVLMPAITCANEDIAGNWKNDAEVEDYIIEIDNKSITHRPDLWSHRGVAREIAALLEKPFITLNDILLKCPVREYEHFTAATQETPFTITNRDLHACTRFAAFYFSQISYTHSWLWMAQRLAKIDAKSINALVDLTNYVMFDVGQPLHAFDADTIRTKKIVPRKARLQEKLLLLDDQEIELVQDDLIISDEDHPIALAGIMGGKETAVGPTTNSMLVEAANFDAVLIRKSAQRHKLRTESSIRFEKTLDPNLNLIGLQRFLFLLTQEGIHIDEEKGIVSLGKKVFPSIIIVSHDFIEKKLGVTLASDQIKKVLESLEFGVRVVDNGGIAYEIKVPTFRSGKDIVIPEDIVEEIGRCIGFNTIPYVLPSLITKSHDNSRVFRMRTIKQFFAHAVNAQEIQNYPLYDELFLKQLNFQPKNAVKLRNPLTEHAIQLATSLIPHLIKNIITNEMQYSELRFFEWGRIWYTQNHVSVDERKSLAGILWHQKQEIDFYKEKKYFTELLRMLGCSPSWKKITQRSFPWYHPYKSAQIEENGYVIGYIGMINPLFIMDILPGQAFIFELDGDFLLSYRSSEKSYIESSKFQEVVRDISFIIPKNSMVKELESQIMNIDGRIESVTTIDFFESNKWKDSRSLTLRITMNDKKEPIDKNNADALMADVVSYLEKMGATIR